MRFPGKAKQRTDDSLSYRCLDTGVHVVPLQIMMCQVMISSGKCIHCGQELSARTARVEYGTVPERRGLSAAS